MDALVTILIPVGILGGLFVYPPLQNFAAFRLKSFWRFFALIPLLAMGYVLTVTILAFLHESNVWPILLIFAAPVALLYLIVLFAIHWLVSGRNVSDDIQT
jgi:hypothetical protein